jgi:hypothetical protein
MLFPTSFYSSIAEKVFVMFVLLFILPFVFFVQEIKALEDVEIEPDVDISEIPESVVDSIGMSDGVTVATVNIDSVTYEEANSGVYSISAVISNDIGYQPGVRAYVRLIQKNDAGGEFVADVMPHNEVFDIGEKETREITFEYSVPASVVGNNLSLWLHVEGVNGLPLGFTPIIENFAVSSEQKEMPQIYIQSDSCFLTVQKTDGQIDETAYHPEFGVDVDGGAEKLFLQCDVTNNTTSEQIIIPRFLVFERTYVGTEQTPESNALDIDNAVILPPQETVQVTLPLPLPEKPQSYVARVSFVHQGGDGGVIDGVVHARYVVRGESATLQNVVFDKNRYQVGDVAQVDFLH